MYKRNLYCLFASLLTVLCIVIGFFLPGIISGYVDKQEKNNIETYNMEKVEFQNTSNLQNVLTLVSQGYYTFEQSTSSMQMTKEQVLKREKELFEELTTCGISMPDLDSSFIYHKEQSMLAVASYNQANNDGFAAIYAKARKESDNDEPEDTGVQSAMISKASIWTCEVVDEQQNIYHIVIDDLTGSLLQMNINYTEPLNQKNNSPYKESIDTANSINDFFKKCYSEYEIDYYFNDRDCISEDYDSYVYIPTFYYNFYKNKEIKYRVCMKLSKCGIGFAFINLE